MNISDEALLALALRNKGSGSSDSSPFYAINYLGNSGCDRSLEEIIEAYRDGKTLLLFRPSYEDSLNASQETKVYQQSGVRTSGAGIPSFQFSNVDFYEHNITVGEINNSRGMTDGAYTIFFKVVEFDTGS